MTSEYATNPSNHLARGDDDLTAYVPETEILEIASLQRENKTQSGSSFFEIISNNLIFFLYSLNKVWIFLAAFVLCVIISLPTLEPRQGSDLNLFGWGAVKIMRTPYGDQWSKARQPLPVSQRAMVSQVKAAPNTIEQISRVQIIGNSALRYEEDIRLYGKSDYWATPREALSHRAGDCEDSAILKMAMLVALGFPEEQMFLTVGQELVSRRPHAVLTVEHDGELYVLDQLSSNAVKMSEYRDFSPIVTLSKNNSWIHGKLKERL